MQSRSFSLALPIGLLICSATWIVSAFLWFEIGGTLSSSLLVIAPIFCFIGLVALGFTRDKTPVSHLDRWAFFLAIFTIFAAAMPVLLLFAAGSVVGV
jgi:hypothetical protein